MRVRIEGDFVALYPYPGPNSYDIPLRELRDSSGRDRWLSHLGVKRWGTPDVLWEVERLALSHWGRNGL